jgi:hypothetical protein
VKDRKLANRGGGWALQPQRWMMFVDGENLTIRTQEFAKEAGLDLVEGPSYRKDTFLWLKGLPGTYNLANPTHPLQAHAARAYYYTSLVGDPNRLRLIESALKELEFTPRVFLVLPASATIAGQSYAVGASVACRAMPLSPIPALTAPCAVPGAGVRNDLSQTERVPVTLAALAAPIQVDELFQGHLLAPTGKIHLRIEIGPGERFVPLDIVDRASRHPGDVHAIEGIAAVHALTAILARLPVSAAGATFGMTSVFTSARQGTLHKCILQRVG